MKVLICPLDWGLGHAARCIPVVRALLKNGHTVVIGASGGGLRLLRAEFPDLTVFDFPGYRVRYSRSPALFLPMLLAQAPALLAGWLWEGARLRRLLDEHRPDLVISDGRYGVCAGKVPCVFITHQIAFPVPKGLPGKVFVERILLFKHLFALRRFRQVWVPDFPGPNNLSGALSHKPCNLPGLRFVYPLCRFKSGDRDWSSPEPGKAGVPITALALVSGPEPQRALFESVLRRELSRWPGTRVLIRGLPGTSVPGGAARLATGALNVFDHLEGEVLRDMLASAALVVARSGYTTVMELAGLGQRNVVLVPTPGQPEQEYLADHLEAAKAALRVDQSALDLTDIHTKLVGYQGFAVLYSGNPRGASGGFTLESFLRENPLLQKN